MLRKFWLPVILLVVLIGCNQAANVNSPQTSLTPASSPVQTVWIDPDLPDAFQAQIVLPEGWQQVDQISQSGYQIVNNGDLQLSGWIYVLVAPFPTITDNISSNDLKDFWSSGSSETLFIDQLVMDEQTYTAMSDLLGDPASGLVEILPQDQILDTCWDTIGKWSIVAFEQLEPRWKVIAIDGNSPIQKEFDPSNYLLGLTIGLTINTESTIDASDIPADLLASLQITNRDPEKMSVVVVTGVTAMVRATAAMMEWHGMTYPAKSIGDILRSADITHISNEIAFSPTCPEPTYMGEVLIFCSQPEYIELLEYVGTDVIELTGDHLIDVSPEDVLYTLEMYRERGWGYYGGGKNIEDARQALLLSDHSNQIAFIGCNAKPVGYARASETEPGAVHCDWDYLDNEIPLVRQNGYLPIMTFSHLEYYSYGIAPELQTDFHRAADDGAIIVSGSQGHQPQAMEFYNGAFLHYGLGNLFFDQFNEGEAQRQAFIDRHVFYNGRYISTELITIIFVDYAQARLMTSEERAQLLTTVFRASGWTNINP